MKRISEKLGEIEDVRHESYIKYRLGDLLTIILCGVLCGLDSLESLHIFAESHANIWKNQLGLDTVPSKATLGRILCIIDGDAVGKVMLELMKEQLGVSGTVVAVDGKAVCSTGKKDEPHSALQILTAYLTENGVVLGQKAIHEKTNEIPVFQEMLDYLDLDGKTVTADAMHCQRETCEKIAEKQGGYVIGLKQNQPSLYEDVDLYYQNETDEAFEICKSTEKNAGRLETRICRKLKDCSWLEPRHHWLSLTSVFAVERITEERGHTSRETCYYISNLDESAERFMQIAREHWKIESLHWMLDVIFSEDDSYFFSENAHKTLNIMRKYALAVHKRYISAAKKKTPIKSSMLACLLDFNKLLFLLQNL